MRVVVQRTSSLNSRLGFQIGAGVVLPFLVIDMAVASITTAVGMMQLPPVVISRAKASGLRDGGRMALARRAIYEELLLNGFMKPGNDHCVVKTDAGRGNSNQRASADCWDCDRLSVSISAGDDFSIQEVTISTVPRLAAVAAALFVSLLGCCATWLLLQLSSLEIFTVFEVMPEHATDRHQYAGANACCWDTSRRAHEFAPFVGSVSIPWKVKSGLTVALTRRCSGRRTQPSMPHGMPVNMVAAVGGELMIDWNGLTLELIFEGARFLPARS